MTSNDIKKLQLQKTRRRGTSKVVVTDINGEKTHAKYPLTIIHLKNIF